MREKTPMKETNALGELQMIIDNANSVFDFHLMTKKTQNKNKETNENTRNINLWLVLGYPGIKDLTD